MVNYKRFWVGLVLVLSVAGSTLEAGEILPAATPVQEWELKDGLPEASQGKFPIHLAKYEGVDQLILLSAKWLIVVTNNFDEVQKRIDALSGGKYQEAVDLFEKTRDTGRPNWDAFHSRVKLRDTYVAQAREEAGERKLDEAAYYAISGNDSRYAKALPPLRVTRVIVGLGEKVGPAQGKLRGLDGVFYAHYSYLELPEALEHGKTYTVALKDGRQTTFVYDELRTVSRAIKVNQAGYLPSAKNKYAYLGGFLFEHGTLDVSATRTFKVVDVNSGQVVLTGEAKPRAQNPRFGPIKGKEEDAEKRPLIIGEDLYELDLNGLQAEGTFFITMPGVGRSWPFRHAADVYGEPFYLAARGLYHQRCGIALESPYTAWKRIQCHTDPICECGNIPFGPGANFQPPRKFDRFDVIGGTLDASKTTPNPCGGWHDAADWDRNIPHYVCVLDLLHAFELAPKLFSDGQLNLPESGNGIPDVLDEAEFGLEVWRRSMDERGGVSGMVETWTHPKIDDPKVKYAYSVRTRWSSLIFAASAAQYAQLVEPFNKEKAALYAAAAKKAFAFGSDPAHSLGKFEIQAKAKRGQGEPYTIPWEEKDAMVKPFLAHAAVRMHLLTRDDSWLKHIPDLSDVVPPYEHPNSFKDYSPWMYFDLARGASDKLPAAEVARWRKFLIAKADEKLALADGFPYRCTWPIHQDFWMGWGASTMTNYSRALLIAWQLTRDEKYRQAAIVNADYMFGANPTGMSWTTGIGYQYPIDIQHENSEADGITDPVPGLTIYGLTGGMYPQLRMTAWSAVKAPGSRDVVEFMKPANRAIPIFRQWSCHPRLNVPQNEFTVHETMSSTIFTCAMLLPEGWKPSEDLKKRGPRPEECLFGYYYLP
ncbi:MAG: glycoside hydrolase family 9 protein [Planctomycetes bacterium]|nr:glycoside hydrolase family 9 protein [Planctomycetota bacterium]